MTSPKEGDEDKDKDKDKEEEDKTPEEGQEKLEDFEYDSED